MSTYERIRTASERTREGVLNDLARAYAADNSEQLLKMARTGRIEQAQRDALFSDIAISRGATAYNEEKPKATVYSEEEKDILKEWEKHGAPKI